ncbi:MAG: APC family permease [Candidatus Methanoperedens sp.]|nr:APC family permease [Candidatus Methanoperedens sp.]
MSEYRKNLGLAELVSFGVGGTIGSGIFVVPGIAAGLAGPSSLLAWLMVAISASCVMLSLAWASSKYPSTGAFYSIFSKVFGRRLSGSVVILYLIGSVFGIATIAAGIGQYVTFFGYPDVLWLEIVIIALLGIINIIGVRPSGNIENVLTLLKTLPLIVLAIFLLPYILKENFTPFFTGNKTDFLKVAIIVYWPYTGFEISAIPAGETRNIKDVFASLVIVMLITTTVYLFLNVALIGSMGSGLLASSSAPLALAAAKAFHTSGKVMAVIGIIAMLSALNAYILAASRVLQNISFENSIRLLPDLSRKGTPYMAIAVSAAVGASLLLFTNHFAQLATISVLATLLPYIFICVATLKLFENPKIRTVAAVGLVSTLAILATFVL